MTFHHHDIKGARLARKRLQALRFDAATTTVVTRLVELHLRFFGYAEGAWTDAAVRRYVRDAGDELERLHILTRADVTTRNKRKAQRLASAYDDIEARIAALREQEEIDSIRPELDGNRIQEVLGLTPGREVGEAYRFLLELRLDEACSVRTRPRSACASGGRRGAEPVPSPVGGRRRDRHADVVGDTPAVDDGRRRVTGLIRTTVHARSGNKALQRRPGRHSGAPTPPKIRPGRPSH